MLSKDGTTKVCTRCKQEKALDLFSRLKRGGYEGRCKECERERTRQRLHGPAGVVVATMPPADLDYSTLRYDYNEIDLTDRLRVMDAALVIRQRHKRLVEDMIAIGNALMRVKEVMAGKFTEWLQTEFAMSVSSANEFMNIARRFGDVSTIIVEMGSTVARLLAAPSVPDDVAFEVVELIKERASTELPPLKVGEVKDILRSREAAKKSISGVPLLVDKQRAEQAIDGGEYRVIAPEPKTLSAEWPDDPALKKTGFVIHRTDQGWRFFWPTRGDRPQSYGPIRSVKEYAEEDALRALAEFSGYSDVAAAATSAYKGVAYFPPNVPEPPQPTPPSADELAAIAIVEAEREKEDEDRAERDRERAGQAPADPDMLQLMISRSMVRKLHVALLRGTRLKDMFTGEELDRLNIVLSRALRETEGANDG